MSQNRNFFSQSPQKPTNSQLNAVSLYFTQALTDGKTACNSFEKRLKNKLNQNNPNWPLAFMTSLDLLLTQQNDEGKLLLYSPLTIDYQNIPEVVKTAAKSNNISTLLFSDKAYITLLDNNMILFDDVRTGKNTKMSAEEYITKSSLDRKSIVIRKTSEIIEELALLATLSEPKLKPT